MKQKNILYALVLTTILGSCTTNFDKYNTDNSRLGEDAIVAEALIDPLIYDGNRYLVQRSFQLHGELMQYYVVNSTTSMNDYHRYDVKETESDVLWRNLYHWATQARYMEMLADDPGSVVAKSKGLKGIANIMEVLMISNLTDVFGDMPYRESLMVKDHILQPKYDSQELIYDSMLVKLERANTLLAAADMIDKDDILYHGDCKQWRKFGNSLQLRLLMRLSRKEGYVDVSGKIKKIFNSPALYPIFESVDDRATLRFTGMAPNTNYYKSTTVPNFETSRHISEFMIGLMVNAGDPRLDAMFTRPAAAEMDWYGVPSGVSAKELQPQEAMAAFLDGKWRADNHSFALMNYSEVKFILAEAAVRGYITADPEQLYLDGIRASCAEQCDYLSYGNSYGNESLVNAFLARAGVKFPATGTSEQKIAKIIEQKYISLFFVGFEAWNDYRRTGYPVLPMGDDLRNDGILPTRLQYPNSESSRNKKNWNAAIQVQGPDDMQTKVWWAR